MSIEEMSAATGVERDRISELESFGIVCSHGPDGARYYDGDDYIVLSIVKDFFRYGIEPRHLTMYKHFADREATFFEDARRADGSVRRTPTRAVPPRETLADLSVTSRKFKQALLRTNLRRPPPGRVSPSGRRRSSRPRCVVAARSRPRPRCSARLGGAARPRRRRPSLPRARRRRSRSRCDASDAI